MMRYSAAFTHLEIGSIDSKDFSARCSGSGDIRIEGLSCDDFDGSVSGSGTMRLGSISCELEVKLFERSN